MAMAMVTTTAHRNILHDRSASRLFSVPSNLGGQWTRETSQALCWNLTDVLQVQNRKEQVLFTSLAHSNMVTQMLVAVAALAAVGLAAADDGMQVVSSVQVLNNENFEHLTQASTGTFDVL